MTLNHEWFSPTRSVGLAAYGLTIITCGLRWRIGRRRDESTAIFGILTVVQLALLLDMAFDWRWMLHDHLMERAISLGVYGEREVPQIAALLLLLVGVVTASMVLIRRNKRRLGLGMAMAGTLLSCALWCSEWVSYHFVDTVFYHFAGGLMVVSFLWMINAGITCVGAWLDGRA
jgi:uncharacterized membrane protein YidH (DUF202 family)